ncbi:MAG: HNH endonuclease, partial [Betaproteobacteria bacterium]|nr:HNH endonuclease [Betaproteobacteria bacterium]
AQANKELAACSGSIVCEAKTYVKWQAISGQQDLYTTNGVIKGAGKSVWDTAAGLAHILTNLPDTIKDLQALVDDPAVRNQVGSQVIDQLNGELQQAKTDLQVGGTQNADNLGQLMGGILSQVAMLGVGGLGLVGDAAKGAEIADEAGAAVQAGVVAGPTNSVGADAGAAADWVKPSGWRLPVTNGQWSGTPGNSNWASFNDSVNAITGGQPIPFRNGYPDFSQWSQGTFTFDNLTGTNTDFGVVYDAVAQEYGLANRTAGQNLLRDLGLTPHHVEDGLTIELVPTDVHGNVPHIGGASNLRNGN